MFNTDFPNPFGSTMVGQLETDGALKLLSLKSHDTMIPIPINLRHSVRAGFAQSYLSWPDLDVEVTAFVGDLEDFGPSEAIYPQTILID